MKLYRIGDKVNTPDGNGIIKEVNAPAGLFMVKLDNSISRTNTPYKKHELTPIKPPIKTKITWIT